MNLLTDGEWVVRRAKREFDEIQWLVTESHRMACEDWKVPEFMPADPNRCGQLWDWCVAEHFVLIAEKRGERAGFIAGFLVPHPYNPELRTLHSTLWYVAPHARRTRCGYLLAKAFTDWGVENVDYLSLTLHRKSGDRMMEHLGYDDVERTFTQWGKSYASRKDATA